MTINTQAFIIPFIPITLKYKSYENNIATFELGLGNDQFNQALGMIGNSYQSKMPEYIKLELPNVLIDLQKLLEKKNIKGVQVKEITQTNNQLKIITE